MPTDSAPEDAPTTRDPDRAPSGPDAAPAPAVYFGRYRVVRELGRGGMGVVFLAHDELLGIPVALKLLPPEVVQDAEAIAELRAEVLRGIALTHPGIVRIYTFEKDEAHAAIVMEYVDGASLAELKQAQPGHCYDAEQLLPWIEQLCAALAYAHTEAKLVHRDLKPRNLMITAAGRLKVADFGIAASLSETSSRVSQLRSGPSSGTPAYMSPQQVMGARPSVQDDIYALGATLFELLSGKPPFFRGNILAQVQEATPPSVAERRAERGVTNCRPVPSAWEAAIARCLEKEPEKRPASAMEVLALLQAETTPSPRRRRSVALWVGGGMTLAVWILFFSRPKPQPFATPVPVKFTAPTAAPATPLPTVITGPLEITGPLVITAPTPRKMEHPPMPFVTPSPAAPGVRARAGQPFTNSLGMKFVPIEHSPVLCSIWETRMGDYASFAHAENRPWTRPNFKHDQDHPVVGVTWDDAVAFCAWLTAVERQNGWLGPTQRYRLPTAHEWSCAAGYGDRDDPTKNHIVRLTEFHFTGLWGSKQWPPPAGAGNFADETLQREAGALLWIKGYDDGFAHTAPVGSFQPNKFGIYDLAGNAMEWCEDLLVENTNRHILRGGSWNTDQLTSLSVADHMSTYRYATEIGFRCVLDLGAKK